MSQTWLVESHIHTLLDGARFTIHDSTKLQGLASQPATVSGQPAIAFTVDFPSIPLIALIWLD